MAKRKFTLTRNHKRFLSEFNEEGFIPSGVAVENLSIQEIERLINGGIITESDHGYHRVYGIIQSDWITLQEISQEHVSIRASDLSKFLDGKDNFPVIDIRHEGDFKNPRQIKILVKDLPALRTHINKSINNVIKPK